MHTQNKNGWRSRMDGIRSAKAAHFCTSCMHQQTENWLKAACPSCGGHGSRVYMKSEVELKRAAELILQVRMKQITDLRFQPRYDLKVEGRKICTYVSDFEYRNSDGTMIVEDVKPLKFIDKEAKLKIALFDALYARVGLHVTLHKKGA